MAPKDPHLPGIHTCVVLSPLSRVGLRDWKQEAEVMTGQDSTCNTGLWKTAGSISGARPLLDLWECPAAIEWGHFSGLWEDHEVTNGGLWPTANRNWGLPLLWGQAWTWVFPVMIQPSEKPWVKPPSYTILILIPRKRCESTSWIYLLFKFLVMCYTAIGNLHTQRAKYQYPESTMEYLNIRLQHNVYFFKKDRNSLKTRLSSVSDLLFLDTTTKSHVLQAAFCSTADTDNTFSSAAICLSSFF